MTKEIIFAVGSQNPVKINCVAEALIEIWPRARVVGVDVESGVSRQPMSEHETFNGAFNRANEALKKLPSASCGVGIEGGSLDDEDGLWAYAWVVVVNREGKTGKGQTGRFLLPEPIGRLVREGLELGEADDRFFGRENSKQKDGAIGILSDGLVTRLDLYKPAVIFALLPFIHPEFYESPLRKVSNLI
jgi:inosine/xanthosine triphosphatase